jgi:hypothetical protein
MIFGVSQIMRIRKIAMRISVTTGKKAIRIVDPIATTSSVKLSATFETGSGLVFAASLVAAFFSFSAIIVPAPADWQVEFTALCGYSSASLPMFIHCLLAFR